MLSFLLSSMLAVGLSLTLQQIVVPLKNPGLVLGALVANFVIVPIIAIGVSKMFRLEQSFALGLLLLGLAPGAPFLPKLAAIANGDVAFSVALMVLLMVVSLATLSIALPRLLPGASVSLWQIARPHILFMLIPLAVGLWIKGRFPPTATKLQPILNIISSVSLTAVIVLVLALNLPGIKELFGTGAIAAGLVFTVLAAGTGYVLGGSQVATRRVMMLGTSFRNIAAALVLDEQDFKDSRAAVMLLIASLLGLGFLIPVSQMWHEPTPERKT